MRFRLALLFVALALVALPSAAHAQVGGPVILGGDDLTDHGSRDSVSGASQAGWLYIEKAIGNIKPKVGRANDNSIAVIGSGDPGLTFPSDDAGAAIKNAAQKNAMGVRFFNGVAEVNSGFAQIANGTYRPRIIWISGDKASNDLRDSGPCSDGDPVSTEGEAVAANRTTINNFVNQGGGLMSHGTCYTFLSALVPGLTTVNNGGSRDLFLTPAGSSAFPGLSNSDVNSGPWHNFFQGNFGGLQRLVLSNSIDDASGQDAAVIIGGGQVSLTQRPADVSITKSASPSPGSTGQDLTYTLTVRNAGPGAAPNTTVVDTLPGGLSARSATASQGSCSGTTTVGCSLGTLATGATATVTVVVRPTSAGTLTNTAMVGAGAPDPNLANNTASVSTTINEQAATNKAPTNKAPKISLGGVPSRGSCVTSSFRVRVRVSDASSKMRRVDVRLDGKIIKRSTSKSFLVRIPARSIGGGRHRIGVAARDRGTPSRRSIRRARFGRCARVNPFLTG